jgi:S1-C subfamily serine protease
MRRLVHVAVIAALLLASMLAGCSDGGSSSTPSSSTAAPAPETSAPGAGSPSGSPAADLQNALISVVKKVVPSVVEISTPTGLGSGVIYDARGYIVTNAHVVGTDRQFNVTFHDGRTREATLVGSFVPDDLAVIKTSGTETLVPLQLADSSRVEVGQIAIAVGNPLGLASSVTEGIVGYNGRTVSEGNGVVLPSTIQTSAAINPGNSGGALVDLDGKLIGIPTLAASSPELGGAAPGIGFAIPSNTVRLIADQFINQGQVTNSGRAALGIGATSVTDQAGRPIGVIVRSVTAGGPADASGIKVGDIITAIDAKPTTDLTALSTVLASLQPGASVKIDVLHADGTKATTTVRLGSL